jgi:hypothetical protein
MVSEIGDSDTVTLSTEYREYFAQLGRAIGDVSEGTPPAGALPGHLRKTVRVNAASGRILTASALDIVTERLEGARFDLVVATNILPYFDDTQLTLAMSNISSMLVPGGSFLHNEARPLLQELSAPVGLPFEQSRHAIIATVRGAPAPLFDSVWLHRKREK